QRSRALPARHHDSHRAGTRNEDINHDFDLPVPQIQLALGVRALRHPQELVGKCQEPLGFHL
nr:hypothetical protein [Streptomyces sp. DSM 41633]